MERRHPAAGTKHQVTRTQVHSDPNPLVLKNPHPPTGEVRAEPGRCRALYSFTSQQEDQLSMKEGNADTRGSAPQEQRGSAAVVPRRCSGRPHQGRRWLVVRRAQREDRTLPLLVRGGAAGAKPSPVTGSWCRSWAELKLRNTSEKSKIFALRLIKGRKSQRDKKRFHL